MGNNSSTTNNFNWIPDVPDQRDHYISNLSDEIDENVDLRPIMIYNKVDNNTILNIFSLYRLDFEPSCWFVKNILAEHNYPLTIRNVFKVINRYGICPNEYCCGEGVVSKEAYSKCVKKHTKYRKIFGSDILKVLSKKIPIICGISIYESFINGFKQGRITEPAENEKVIGSDVILILGYNFKKRQFLIKKDGYSWMSFGTIKNCSDFWAAKKEEVITAPVQKEVEPIPKEVITVQKEVEPVHKEVITAQKTPAEKLEELHDLNRNGYFKVEKVFEFKDDE